VLSIDRWIGEFQALGLPPEVEQRVMLDNARKLLRVDGA
jgi:predicted TIM-barrel fold metal-dependent hydrolase